MFTFDNPDMFFLFILIPLIIIIHFFTVLYFSRKAFKFANFETLRRLQEKEKVFSKRLPQMLFRLFFVTVLVFAAADTSFWWKTEGFTEDVMIAIDTSGSMLADDIDPTRIDAAKEALKTFISNNSEEVKFGIISFTSLAYLEQYPTYDALELISALEKIKVRKSRGTSIGEAINFGTAILGEEVDKEKNMIILTDGQENVLVLDELLEIIDNAKSKKININVIGIGTDTGAAIEKETLGRSILNEDTLRMISEESGGKYVVALEKKDIVEALKSFVQIGEIERKYSLTFSLYVVAFVILIIEWYLSNFIFRAFP